MTSSLSAAGSTRRWRKLRLMVLERDGWRCQLPADGVGDALCHAWAAHVDHITPRAAGGTDDLANLRAACATHNLRRGSGLPRSTAARPRPALRRWSW